MPDAAAPQPAAPLTAEAATAIVGNERFLPIAEPVIVAPAQPGPLRIFAPVGTAVHVIEAGRVADTDQHIAGEVTIRVDGDRFYRYRRLLPSSIVVDAGENVPPGAVIGVVGESVDGDPPCLVVGLQSGAGEWSDLHRILVGLPDPGELGLAFTTDHGTWVDPLAADTEGDSR